jgi:anti-sigma factor RsiW
MSHDTPSPDDLALSALIDGALPESEARALRERLASDPALAARLATLSDVDTRLKAAYGRIADEPVPASVAALLREELDAGEATGNVLPFRSRVLRPLFTLPSAIAAGVALIAGFLFAHLMTPELRAPGPLPYLAGSGLIAAGSPLHDALERVPSGESRQLDGALSASPRLSFRTADGAWCRQLEIHATEGTTETLACRGADGWQVALASFRSAAPVGADETVYRPASGLDDSPIELLVDTIIDGEPLGPAEERLMIEQRWAR